MKYNHVMVDLETMSNKGNAAIVSIGVVAFDNVILRNAYGAVGLEPFWKHWNNRCVRTVVELGRNAGIDPKKTLQFEGEPHNALDDAIHQAKYVSIIHQHLIKPVNDDI